MVFAHTGTNIQQHKGARSRRVVGHSSLIGLWKVCPSLVKWQLLKLTVIGCRLSLPHSNVRHNSALWPQLHNFVRGRNLSREFIRRTYYLKRQFAGPLRTKFEVVCLSYADGELSGAEFALSCWKVRAVFCNRPPCCRCSCDLQADVDRGILWHDIGISLSFSAWAWSVCWRGAVHARRAASRGAN